MIWTIGRFHLNATFRDELHLLSSAGIELEGFSKFGFCGIVTINIGMVKSSDTRIQAGIYHLVVLGMGKSCAPDSPAHTAGYGGGDGYLFHS